MNTRDLAIGPLNEELFAAQKATLAALEAGDVAGEIDCHLQVAAIAEALIELADPVTHADIAIRHRCMVIDDLFKIGREDEAKAQEARAEALAARWYGQVQAFTLRLDQAIRGRERGQFAAALATLAELRGDAEAVGAPEIAIKAAMIRGETLQWLGDPIRALEELDRVSSIRAPPTPLGKLAQSIEKFVPTEPGTAEALRALQVKVAEEATQTEWNLFRFLCLRDLSEHDPAQLAEAASALDMVAAHYRAEGWGAAVDLLEAQLALRRGQADQARAVADNLAEVFRADQRLRHRLGAVLELRAGALKALGQIADAHFAALAATDEDANNWRAWLLAAETLPTSACDTERRAILAEGVAAVERMRLAPLGWRLDNLYLKPRLSLYQQAITQAAVDKDGPTALSLIEAVKSRALTAIIGKGRGVAPHADPVLIRDHRSLDDTIARLQAAIVAGDRSKAAAEELEAQRRQRADLTERLRHADPRWRMLTAHESTPPAAIVEAARRLKAVALDFFLNEAELTVILVSDGDILVNRHFLPKVTLQALHGWAQDLLSSPVPFMKDPASLGISLSDLLSPDFAARVGAASRVLIAAHGPLHLLAWPALPTIPGGKRLIENAEVGLLPNLGCLPALEARALGTGWCVALGAPERNFGLRRSRSLKPPACHTATDVAALHAANDTLVAPPVIGVAATTEAFARLCAAPRASGAILHITSHGMPPRSEPGDASLQFADVDLEAAAIAHAGILSRRSCSLLAAPAFARPQGHSPLR